MKRILALTIGLAALAFCSWAAAGPSCCNKAKSTSASASAACEKGEKTSAATGDVKAEGATCEEKAVKLSITGMHCGDCSKKVQAALSKLEGVRASKVSYTRKNAEVVYNANQISEEGIISAVNGTGFTVASSKASNWRVTGSEDCCKAAKTAKAAESGT